VDNARLYEDGQAANRAMEDMLSVVAHDLRNPLNTIVTSGSLLNLNVPAEQHRMANTSIRHAAEQMSRLLDDLLDITRIGQRRLSVDLEPIDVSALVDETVVMHTPVAQARAIRLTRTPPSGAVLIQADPARLVQALSNLMDNALKFTPAGGEVRISVGRTDDAAHVSVTDTGPGIAGDEIPRLFDRFWRSDGNSRTGLGLGLSIAKGIVDAHSGRIEVYSTPGEGSRFTMVLPESPPGG
jgi:signal transduction histidine kinase